MTHILHRLSVLLLAVMLCPVPWGYGGARKYSRTLGSSVPPMSVHQGIDQGVGNEQAELAALDASACVPWTGNDRQQAQALFARLKERRIAIQPTFYKLLGKVAPPQRRRFASLCQVFFNSVDIHESPNTAGLTSMIQNKTQVYSFVSNSDDAVRRVAKTPALKSLTSLFNKQGFPKAQEDTQAFMEWKIWWQGEGNTRILDRELLRTFSSMFSGKRLPNKKAVDDYLKWEVWWQGKGEERTLNRELLRTFSSIFNRRGLPDKQSVEEYLQWPIWWQGKGKARTLDHDLLRCFSSMFNGKGLPDKKSVDDFLLLDAWWQGEGRRRKLDRELLRAFSSMFNGRGLPNKRSVDDYLHWEVWHQGEGQARTLDRELLRIFSSIFCGRGLPNKKTVDDYLRLDVWWQGEGSTRTLDREMLRTFSAIFNRRGILDKKAVEDYLQWDVWWQGEGNARILDRELLRTFSSMFRGKGVPTKKAVDDYIKMEVWWKREGGKCTLDRELLCAFSSQFRGKGLPNKKTVDTYLLLNVLKRDNTGMARTLRINEILRWLTWEEQWDSQAVKVMLHLYSNGYTGRRPLNLPDINKLRMAEQKLTEFIASEKRDHAKGDNILPLIKMVALYLANDGGTQQLHWTDCAAWLRVHPSSLAIEEVLRRLLLTLHDHGGRGIQEAMTLISGKPIGTQQFMLNAMGSGHTLATVQYALGAIDPPQRWEYLFFTRELYPAPSHQQWEMIKGYLDALAPVLSNQEDRRQFLTLIWPFAPADQERFVHPDAVRGLITLLANIQVMRKLSQSLTTNELTMLFDTCLTYRAGQPDPQGLPILFKALLLAQLPLFHHGAIPPNLFAQPHDQPEGVVIRANPTLKVEDLVTLFIQVMAALLEKVWDCQSTVNGQILSLWSHGATVPITLPAPSLEWHPDGVQIRHWTSAHLHRFCQATGCWPGLYWEPTDPSNNVPGPATSPTEPRDSSWTANVTQQAEPPVMYLSVAMLRRILKNRAYMSPAAWASADYHRDKLPLSLLTLLKERAYADHDGLVSESLKRFLFERDHQSQSAASPHPDATWLETVLRQHILSQVDIEQLYSYRDQLTSDQVVDVLFKMDQSTPEDLNQRWQSLLGEKHQQALNTNPTWINDINQSIEALGECEDLLRDLFPDTLL